MKASRILKWFVVCVVLVVLAALGWYVFICVRVVVQRTRNEHDMPVCSSHMRALEYALVKYSHDHKGRLPSANAWCDQILPYLPDRSLFVCPDARNQVCSYALNQAVAGKQFADLHGDDLVVLFESDAGWNATGGPDLLPRVPRHQPQYENVVTAGDVAELARQIYHPSSPYYGVTDYGLRVRDRSGRPLKKYKRLYFEASPQARPSRAGQKDRNSKNPS